MTNSVLRGLVALLSLAGLANAVYFTFAYYGRVRKSRWVPEVLCAREGSSCVTVVQTPYARVFGLPNSLLGIAYYILVMGWLLAGPAIAPDWLPRALVAASAGTVAFGFYLIHALRSKLHVNCPLCYAAHAINLGIFMFLLV